MAYRISEKSYFLSEVSRMNNSQWPIPCVVQDGFYGETPWNTVSSGETLLLGAVQKRRRVLALSSDKMYYSIPYDYPLKFSVVLPNSKDTSLKSISDILSTFKLPVTLQFQQNDSTLLFIRDLKRSTLRLDRLHVLLTYEEKYLVANCIINGVLQKELILLPTFLKIRLRLIEGHEGTAGNDWKAIVEAWKTEYRKSLLNPILPPVDIVMFESLPSEIESTKQTPKGNDEVYGTLEPSAYLTLNHGPGARQANEYTKMTELKSTTKSVSAEKTYTSLQKKSSNDETDLHSGPTKAFADRKTPSSGSSTTPTTKELGQVLQTGKMSETRGPLPPPPNLPKPRSGQPRELPPNATDAAITTAIAAAETHSAPVKTLFHDDADEPPRDYWTSSPSSSPSASPSSSSSQPRSRLRSLRDVPVKIDSLNCGEIADCLRLLEMSKYVEKFQENQVDGTLLVQLDESILTEELMLTPLHAKKLVMFAQKGWRPI